MRLALIPALLLATAAAAAPVTAPLQRTGGKPGGSVTLTEAPRGVLLRVEATGLTPGWHAIHFHEKGDCSDAAFKNSGGHVHEGGAVVHGLLNPQANDQGDLPNIHAGRDGKATADVFSSLVMMASLQDADGAAVVVHAKPDDYAAQPIGGAGDRVACAVIK